MALQSWDETGLKDSEINWEAIRVEILAQLRHSNGKSKARCLKSHTVETTVTELTGYGWHRYGMS